MKDKKLRRGQYAEIMTEYAEHIYRENIVKTERNYKFISVEGIEREVDVLTTLKSGEKIAFEVRDRKGSQGVDWVDQVIGKYQNTPFSKVCIGTFDGCKLSRDAVKKLEHYNIYWRAFVGVDIDKETSKPILVASAVIFDTENVELTINGEKHTDLCTVWKEGDSPVSYVKSHIEQSKHIVSENFAQFDNINEINWEDDIPLTGIRNNFDKDIIKVKLNIPIKHDVFVDYIDEKYLVKNDKETTELFCTHNKSMFITGDTLAIDFSCFYSQDDNIVFNNNFLIDIEEIVKIFGCNISHIKFMDVKGKGKLIPIKIYGIRK